MVGGLEHYIKVGGWVASAAVCAPSCRRLGCPMWAASRGSAGSHALHALLTLKTSPHLPTDRPAQALKEMIFLPLVYPELFERFHIAPPRGVLFYGPPGAGRGGAGGAGPGLRGTACLPCLPALPVQPCLCSPAFKSPLVVRTWWGPAGCGAARCAGRTTRSHSALAPPSLQQALARRSWRARSQRTPAARARR